METTTKTNAHNPVGFGGAFVRQFRFLWTSRRPLLLAVALLAVLVLAGDPWTQDTKMRLFTVWPVWLFIVPIFWALAVFYNEGPDDRYYFWSQPTGRATHVTARLASGVAWMWITYAILILAGWILGLVDGDAWQLGEIGAVGWLNYFTGPLLIYLSICVLTVPSSYPLRWFFGILFGFPLLISLFEDWLTEREEFLETVFAPLIDNDWGFFVTTGGAIIKEIDQLEVAIRQMADPGYVSGRVFEGAQQWGVATPIWIVVMVAIVVWIATRHPDTLPKLSSLKFWA